MSPRFNLDEYEPVEVRLEKFWADHEGGRVTTDLIHSDGSTFVVKAFLFREGEDLAFATGYAEEVIGSSPVNRTSALENAETSAIGRALANANYAAKGKRPSREEMDKVERAIEMDPPGSESERPVRSSKSVSSGGGTPETRLASEKQRYMLLAKLKKKGVSLSEDGDYPDGWRAAGLPMIDGFFPFAKVNDALELIDALPDQT